jgi:predicted nucleic acid-binding protein
LAVLDASFLVKLAVREPGSEEALSALERLLDGLEDVSAPCIALAEALNAVWKHAALLSDIGVDEALRASKRLLSIWRLLRVYTVDELAGDAMAVALKAHIPVYDALYIALAQRLKEPLYTFDHKLAAKARSLGVRAVVPRGE